MLRMFGVLVVVTLFFIPLAAADSHCDEQLQQLFQDQKASDVRLSDLDKITRCERRQGRSLNELREAHLDRLQDLLEDCTNQKCTDRVEAVLEAEKAALRKSSGSAAGNTGITGGIDGINNSVSPCATVRCARLVRKCPAGQVWGKAKPTDCCNSVCVPENPCAGIMCAMFIKSCPEGQIWGKAKPTDCCPNACVPVDPVVVDPNPCATVRCARNIQPCPDGQVWGKANPTDCCNSVCVPVDPVVVEPNPCATVRCARNIQACPGGQVWGKAKPTDCCNSVCVPVDPCQGIMCAQFIKACPAGQVWGKAKPTDCCNNACVPAGRPTRRAAVFNPADFKTGHVVSRVRTPFGFPLDMTVEWYREQCRADPRNLLACSAEQRQLERTDVDNLNEAQSLGITLNIPKVPETKGKDYQVDIMGLLDTFSQPTALSMQLKNAKKKKEDDQGKAQEAQMQQQAAAAAAAAQAAADQAAKAQKQAADQAAAAAAAKAAADKAAADAAAAAEAAKQQQNAEAQAAAAAAAAAAKKAADDAAAQKAAADKAAADAAAAAKQQADQEAARKAAADAAAAAAAAAAANTPKLTCVTANGQKAIALASSKRLLFVSFGDKTDPMTCSKDSTCLNFWPPPSGPIQSDGTVTCALSSVTRSDTGDVQWTCGGRVLYFSKPDTAPLTFSQMFNGAGFTLAPCN